MAEVLLIAENAAAAAGCAAFGQSYGKSYDILCLTESAPANSGADSQLSAGLSEVPLAEVAVNAVVAVADGYRVIGGVASMYGKDLLPRIAGLLDRPMVSDIIEIESERRFKRPMYAGNITATVEVEADEFILSFRSTAFGQSVEGKQPQETTFPISGSGKSKRISTSEKKGGRQDLTQARVVVSGGRPLKDAETFEKLIGGLADTLGGAAGATRAAVDSGIAPNELQVGQTGKIVAPELYFAIGVSGSTQHIAGMKDSKVIVAINTDPDAPIFEIADFGLVQDLYTAIPEILEKIG